MENSCPHCGSKFSKKYSSGNKGPHLFLCKHCRRTVRPDGKRPPCPHCGRENPKKFGFQGNGTQRYKCRNSCPTYNEMTGTPLAGLRSSMDTVEEALLMYMAGMGIADIAGIKGKNEKTILNWTWRILAHCMRFIEHRIKDVKVFFLQFDEAWAFVGKKKNRQWIWTCIDAVTKLFLGFHIGKRTKKHAKKFMKLVKSRIGNTPIAGTSDGYEPYAELVPETFPGMLFGQVVKKYRKNRISEIEKRAINGAMEKIIQVIQELGAGTTINTAFIERLNLTIRQSVNSLGRKVLFFAKQYVALLGKMTIFMTFYNFVRPHMSLDGRTPAMAAGLADHSWSLYEVLTYTF